MRSRRTPKRPTSWAPVTADAMNAVTDVASHDTPVFVAEYPRTCCIRSEPDEDHADRDIDEEDPAPARPVGQQPAGDHADGRRRPAHGAVDPEGAVPLLTLGEGDGEDRERGRSHQGGAEALEPTRRDQE